MTVRHREPLDVACSVRAELLTALMIAEAAVMLVAGSVLIWLRCRLARR